MDKEKIFSKLNSKDYNNQLEKILENKEFSENIKNLLLSMLYKIEAGYKDYTIVKKVVENKKEYIEEILNIIKNKCKKIIIVEEDSDKNSEMEETKTNFLVDIEEETIFLKYPNERVLLYAIYKMNDKQVYLDEKYNLIRNSLSELLNAGENINNIEVLRDFNGWNWNTEIKEIPEISTNVIYQNLIYLLGIEFIKEWVHTEKIVDYVELVETKLTKLYGEENAKQILKQIYKISIIICTSKKLREKERLISEKEILESELNRLNNKKQLLEEISISKKEALNKIKELDTILSDKKLLEEEYIKRNEKRREYNKIFNISHLTEILTKERKKLVNGIEENNRLLDPKFYLQTREKLEKELELLKDIDLPEEQKEKKRHQYMITLQKYFIKCFCKKVENVAEKEEIINLLYMYRYYGHIYLNETVQIKDEKQLYKEINELEEKLIQKAYELKVINRISNEESVNIEIIKKLLLTKIITIENINTQLKQNENALEISIFDGDVFEKTIVIPVFNKKDVLVKLGKYIKIFN